MQSLLALAVRALLFSIAKKVSKNAMPANPLRVPGRQPPLLKNPFTNLKRFLQIRTYSYGKFSLLSDRIEFDLNTFTLNYYLDFKGF